MENSNSDFDSSTLRNFEFMLSRPPLLTKAAVVPFVGDKDSSLLPSPEFSAVVLSRMARAPHLAQALMAYRTERLPLGRYFEQMVYTALLYAYPHHRISMNVLPDHKAPGELDFVLASVMNVIHLEVAIKFYLYVPAEKPSFACFHGPGLKDRFDLKLKKILREQLQRRVPDAAKPCVTASIQRSLWLTGMLFYPWGLYGAGQIPHLRGLNPLHAKGWWIRRSSAPELLDDGSYRLLEPTKQLWIQSLEGRSVPERSWASLAEIQEPVFVVRVDGEDREVDRGFIVPDDWFLNREKIDIKTR